MKPCRKLLFCGLALSLSWLNLAGAATESSTPASSQEMSLIESIIDAIKQWFGSGGGSGTTRPTTQPASDPSPAPQTAGLPTANALADMIASDAGGHADQYAFYADKLAQTLSQLTPAQQARVFGDR